MRLAACLVLLVAVSCGAANPNPAGSPLGEAQLKFAVMDAAGKPQWCDPDYWPIVREGAEQSNAIATYSEIKADAPTYAAIVAHQHLPSGELSDAEKLVLYKAWKLLRPVQLTRSGDGYAFAYTVFPITKLDDFRALEADARANNRGLWAGCNVDSSKDIKQTTSAK